MFTIIFLKKLDTPNITFVTQILNNVALQLSYALKMQMQFSSSLL